MGDREINATMFAGLQKLTFFFLLLDSFVWMLKLLFTWMIYALQLTYIFPQEEALVMFLKLEYLLVNVGGVYESFDFKSL